MLMNWDGCKIENERNGMVINRPEGVEEVAEIAIEIY